ncbi:DHH family phosphoesterase [Candidatus Bathyarchaeota archaeon]|nr:MAG: DHH family phosphoesterase [Candidatus Bathyarchaeota archaeon]
MEGNVEGFLEACGKVGKTLASLVEREGFIPIITHDDPDGLTAGAIMAKAVERLGGGFHLHVVERITADLVEELAQTGGKVYLFSEIGSGYLDLLKPLASKASVIVVDHHKPVGVSPGEITHVNPHLYGIDGSSEVSGSAVCYFVARSLSRENVDLAPLAVVGALGDLQDKDHDRRLAGLNRRIVEEAEKAGLLEVSVDLMFYGRETRPVHKAMASTMNPFIPGLSGREDKCYGFLVNLGIKLRVDDRWRTPAELTQEEKKKIFSEITAYLASLGFKSASIFQLIGEVYTLTRESKYTPLRDGREFASLLNACSKMGRPGLALTLCLGARREALEEAQQLFNEYRRSLSEALNRLLEERTQRVKTLKGLILVECFGLVDEHKLSPVASLISSSNMVDADKPMLAVTSRETGELKVSARAPKRLAEAGLNLGEILRAAAEKVGGRGGGHSVAAGATIPGEAFQRFLGHVAEMVEASLGKGEG